MRYRPIRNSAQLTPSAVRFQTRPPAADLAPFVSDFWQYDVRAPHPTSRIQVFPSGCVVVRFDIGPGEVRPVAYGPSVRPDMQSVFVAGTSAFGVALRLERAPSLIGCDVSELRDRRLDLELLWPGGTEEPCDRLAHTQGFHERIEILTSFLRQRLCRHRTPHSDFLCAVRHLGNGVDTSTLPRDLGLSERSVRRHFERNIGLSPQEVARIMRLQRAMRTVTAHPGTPHLRVALDAGFSDQPHFNREFKRLLGMTPGVFTRNLGRFHEPALSIWKDLNRRMVDWDL
jgi:AraC-like DNA-binding protein